MWIPQHDTRRKTISVSEWSTYIQPEQTYFDFPDIYV